jgi:hypothetical protein
MRSPDLVDPDRLEELLAGSPPEREREADLQRLVRELRTGLPPAPASVRERVRQVEAGRKPRAVRRWRPVAVALAGAAVLAGFGAAALVGDSSPPREAARPISVETAHGEAERLGVDDSDAALGEPSPSVPSNFEAAGDSAPRPPFPDTSRARDVDMSLDVRVRDADDVSKAANEAMRAARELGGYVVSSNVDTRGSEGNARLELRVPVTRLDDAVVELSALGTITAQDVEIADLQNAIDARSQRIEALRRAIRIDELRLASDALTPEERLRVEIRLERTRNLLADVTRARTRLAREAATAEITLALHTRDAPSEEPDESRIEAAAGRALDFLAGAGAVAVFVILAGAPLLALAALAWLFARSRSRRRDDRLLEQPRPAAPPPAHPSA